MKKTWLVSLFALLAVGCVSTGKYKKLEKMDADKGAEITALKAQIDQLNKDKSALETASKQTESDYQNVVNQLAQEVQQGNLKVTQYQNMLSVDVAEQIFFTSGSAKLKKSGQEVLRKVGAALAQYPDKIIRVVGHTDNVPLGKNSSFASNWELSVVRATNVVHFLQDESKINPANLVASGRGEFAPIAPNDTPAGRQKNRRIEIMLLDKGMVEALDRR